MATSSIHCAKCGIGLGRMEDAYAWFDRPLCKACFKHLSARRGLRFRGFWMPIAIGTSVVALGLAVVVGLLLARGTPRPPQAEVPGQPAAGRPTAGGAADATPATPSAGDPTAPTQPADEPTPDPTSPRPRTVALPDPTEYGNLTREQVLAMLRADRTWYWHWERQKKDRPLRFAVSDDGRIATTAQPDSNYVLEQRWVLLHDGHIIVPVGSQRLRGFFVRTGRPVGMFTEEKLGTAK